MTFLIYASNATALIGAALMLLVARGFAPYISLGARDAASLMRLSIVLVSGTIFLRMLWWDAVRRTLGYLGYMPELHWTLGGTAANTLFNAMTIAAALCALAALHRSLPEAEQAEYNWFTAPWYPRRWQLFIRPSR
jgi:hypothetical protein